MTNEPTMGDAIRKNKNELPQMAPSEINCMMVVSMISPLRFANYHASERCSINIS